MTAMEPTPGSPDEQPAVSPVGGAAGKAAKAGKVGESPADDYDRVAEAAAAVVIKRYSTSFGLATRGTPRLASLRLLCESRSRLPGLRSPW